MRLTERWETTEGVPKQWEKLPKGFYEGVTHVLVIFGETVNWISTRKMQEAGMTAWNEDKRKAERDGGGYAAFPPNSLRTAIEYLSDHRPGLKIARTLSERLIVKREGDAPENETPFDYGEEAQG